MMKLTKLLIILVMITAINEVSCHREARRPTHAGTLQHRSLLKAKRRQYVMVCCGILGCGRVRKSTTLSPSQFAEIEDDGEHQEEAKDTISDKAIESDKQTTAKHAALTRTPEKATASVRTSADRIGSDKQVTTSEAIKYSAKPVTLSEAIETKKLETEKQLSPTRAPDIVRPTEVTFFVTGMTEVMTRTAGNQVQASEAVSYSTLLVSITENKNSLSSLSGAEATSTNPGIIQSSSYYEVSQTTRIIETTLSDARVDVSPSITVSSNGVSVSSRKTDKQSEDETTSKSVISAETLKSVITLNESNSGVTKIQFISENTTLAFTREILQEKSKLNMTQVTDTTLLLQTRANSGIPKEQIQSEKFAQSTPSTVLEGISQSATEQVAYNSVTVAVSSKSELAVSATKSELGETATENLPSQVPTTTKDLMVGSDQRPGDLQSKTTPPVAQSTENKSAAEIKNSNINATKNTSPTAAFQDLSTIKMLNSGSNSAIKLDTTTPSYGNMKNEIPITSTRASSISSYPSLPQRSSGNSMNVTSTNVTVKLFCECPAACSCSMPTGKVLTSNGVIKSGVKGNWTFVCGKGVNKTQNPGKCCVMCYKYLLDKPDQSSLTPLNCKIEMGNVEAQDSPKVPGMGYSAESFVGECEPFKNGSFLSMIQEIGACDKASLNTPNGMDTCAILYSLVKKDIMMKTSPASNGDACVMKSVESGSNLDFGMVCEATTQKTSTLKLTTTTPTKVTTCGYITSHMKTLGALSYYFGLNIQITWSGAKEFCKSRNCTLYSPSSRTEHDLVKAYLKTKCIYNSLWTSGNDIATKNVYVWSTTGKNVTFFDWAPNEPNHSNDLERVIVLTHNLNLTWNDISQYHYRSPICTC